MTNYLKPLHYPLPPYLSCTVAKICEVWCLMYSLFDFGSSGRCINPKGIIFWISIGLLLKHEYMWVQVRAVNKF